MPWVAVVELVVLVLMVVELLLGRAAPVILGHTQEILMLEAVVALLPPMAQQFLARVVQVAAELELRHQVLMELAALTVLAVVVEAEHGTHPLGFRLAQVVME
jgi:hypothetical protein